MRGLSPEVSVLALAIGLTFALVCYLITNLSPGGMITPGWLALVLITDPTLGLIIAVVALATYAFSRLMQRFVILYGKRLFATVVLIGVLLQVTVFVFARGAAESLDYTTLGFIIPGLMAYQLIRQPVGATLISTAAVASLAYLVVLAGVALRLVETGTGGSSGLAAESVAERSAVSVGPVQLTLVGLAALFGILALIRSLRGVERLGSARVRGSRGSGELRG